jgi:heme-degrading monooxygenase HmoA
MIGVLTHHWAKLDCVWEADLALKGNGVAQSNAPGFVERKTMYSLNDETQITSLVIWDNEEIYEKWRASPERANTMAGANSLWSKPPESDRFRLAE